MTKPIIITLQIDLKPESKTAFISWQAKLNAAIAAHPGFTSLEFFSPLGEETGWRVSQRFTDLSDAEAWTASKTYLALLDELKKLTNPSGIKTSKSNDSSYNNSVTEIIIVETTPNNEQAYLNWSSKIHQVEATFPGFRGVYVQSQIPSHSSYSDHNKAKGKHWITLLQFDSIGHLDNWMNSPEREQLLKQSKFLISSLESHRVISPYAGWFTSITHPGMPPPSLWKQTMLVLLVLYPIVILELKYLSPLLTGLNPSLSTFIGNALSVSLISFPMMPIALYFLGWWLSPTRKSTSWISLTGTLLVLFLYLLEIAFFWNF